MWHKTSEVQIYREDGIMTTFKEQTPKYLLSRIEVADLFRVSPSTIDRWRVDRQLPYIKIGRGRGKNKTIRYPLDRILQYIKDNTIETKSELMNKYDL